ATSSLVRIEQPRVVSRDETLDVTVCSGRFILEIPPGAERAFGGEHQLAADIEYAAQAAADGSGLVYQIKGAEPIIYKLAAFDLQHGRTAVPGATRVARAELPQPVPSPAPVTKPPVVAVVPAPTPTRVVQARPVARP